MVAAGGIRAVKAGEILVVGAGGIRTCDVTAGEILVVGGIRWCDAKAGGIAAARVAGGGDVYTTSCWQCGDEGGG
mgnify:CR=1 FL=1